MFSRSFQEPPKRPQEPSKRLQDPFWRFQESPKKAQDGPKSSLRDLKRLPQEVETGKRPQDVKKVLLNSVGAKMDKVDKIDKT